MKKQKVVVQLPGIAKAASVETRYHFELEALLPLAELVEVSAKTEEEFLAEAGDASAVITSWGFRISRSVITAEASPASARNSSSVNAWTSTSSATGSSASSSK